MIQCVHVVVLSVRVPRSRPTHTHTLVHHRAVPRSIPATWDAGAWSPHRTLRCSPGDDGGHGLACPDLSGVNRGSGRRAGGYYHVSPAAKAEQEALLLWAEGVCPPMDALGAAQRPASPAHPKSPPSISHSTPPSFSHLEGTLMVPFGKLSTYFFSY